MPHPEEIYGIAVEGDTLFGARPLGKKPPGSVTHHFFVHYPWRRLCRRIGHILGECCHRHHHCTQVQRQKGLTDRQTAFS